MTTPIPGSAVWMVYTAQAKSSSDLIDQLLLQWTQGRACNIYNFHPQANQYLVEQMDEILKELCLAGQTREHCRAFIIYSAQALEQAAGNRLLKSLEEAPQNCLFLLVTDNPESILPTIISRCTRRIFNGQTNQESYTHPLINLFKQPLTINKLPELCQILEQPLTPLDGINIYEQLRQYFWQQAIESPSDTNTKINKNLASVTANSLKLAHSNHFWRQLFLIIIGN